MYSNNGSGWHPLPPPIKDESKKRLKSFGLEDLRNLGKREKKYLNISKTTGQMHTSPHTQNPNNPNRKPFGF